MLRDAWDILHAPVCIDHEVELIERCSCGDTLHPLWRGKAGAFSCPCGTLFANLPTRSASPAAVDAVRWLIPRVEPKTLTVEENPAPVVFPAIFRDLIVSDVISLIDFVGHVATLRADDHRPVRIAAKGYLHGDTRFRSDISSCIACVEAAMPILSNWPDAYYDLLRNIAARNPSTNATRPCDIFATQAGRMVFRPYRGYDGLPLSCLTDALTDFCQLEYGIRPRKKIPARESATARLVGRNGSRVKAAAFVGARKTDLVFQRVYAAALGALDARSGKEPAEAVASLFAEVERRWIEAHSTMTSSELSLQLDHPRIGRDISPWLHPNLLTPAQADDIHVRRRKPSFYTQDVLAMRRRLAALAILTAPEHMPSEYVSYTTVARSLYCGGYNKTQLILDILAGKISVATTSEAPRMSDLFLHKFEAREASREHRLLVIFKKDPFMITSRCYWVLREFWPDNVEVFNILGSRRLRKEGAIRFKTERNTTEGRDRPIYHYSLVDQLERQLLKAGPSISPAVDRMVMANRTDRAKGPVTPAA
jgi:hypothetical protein